MRTFFLAYHERVSGSANMLYDKFDNGHGKANVFTDWNSYKKRLLWLLMCIVNLANENGIGYSDIYLYFPTKSVVDKQCRMRITTWAHNVISPQPTSPHHSLHSLLWHHHPEQGGPQPAAEGCYNHHSTPQIMVMHYKFTSVVWAARLCQQQTLPVFINVITLYTIPPKMEYDAVNFLCVKQPVAQDIKKIRFLGKNYHSLSETHITQQTEEVHILNTHTR